MPSKTPAQPAKAAPEPKTSNCSKCNHPETFHRSGACRVMSCKCSGWNGRKGAIKKRSK